VAWKLGYRSGKHDTIKLLFIDFCICAMPRNTDGRTVGFQRRDALWNTLLDRGEELQVGTLFDAVNMFLDLSVELSYYTHIDDFSEGETQHTLYLN